MELKAATKEAFLAHELFSAMPPLKTIKSPLSFLVTGGIPDHEEQLEMGIFDISRAHFMPKANRELYIKLPDEAKSPGEGDVAGRLKQQLDARLAEPSSVR